MYSWRNWHNLDNAVAVKSAFIALKVLHGNGCTAKMVRIMGIHSFVECNSSSGQILDVRLILDLVKYSIKRCDGADMCEEHSEHDL